MTDASNFRPDKAILKSLRGQPLSVLLEYASTGTLPSRFDPVKEERRLAAKPAKRIAESTAEKILAIRQDYDRIKRALEWYPVAVVLPVIRYHCTFCAEVHLAPQGGELLQYEHPQLGHKAVAIPQHYDTAALPRKLCISDRNGNGCHKCFAGQIIEPQLYLCPDCLSTLTSPGGDCLVCKGGPT
jgi:hypothetical protein